MARELAVQVVAVGVRCELCGDEQRILDPNGDADGFTRTVLEPLLSWWCAHLSPKILQVEVLVDGCRTEQWVPCGMDS